MLSPRMMEKQGDLLLLMDRDHYLWVIETTGKVRAVFGGKGQGPGQFQFLRHASFRDGGVQGLQYFGTGARLDRFNLSGEYLGTKRIDPAVYVNGSERLNVITDGRFPFEPATLEWQQKSTLEKLTLGDEEDRAFNHRYGVIHAEGFTLVYSQTGLKRTVYYALFNARQARVWDQGQFQLLDRRVSSAETRLKETMKPNFSIPVLEGVTASKRYGFVFNEHTVSRDYRILRLYNPLEKSWSAMRIDFEPFGNIIFFQHIEDNRWCAYVDSDELVFFRLEPVAHD